MTTAWVVYNHGDQTAAEAGYVVGAFGSSALALIAAQGVLLEDTGCSPADIEMEHYSGMSDLTVGDYWVRVTSHGVVA